jgi:hypothetical protein
LYIDSALGVDNLLRLSPAEYEYWIEVAEGSFE